MPPSQLKRLRASLREEGIIGPTKSKRQKKLARNGVQRLSRQATLASIREQFNPFEYTHSKGPKFAVTTNRPESKGIKGRPGVSRATADEKRRQTLLPELQARNKVGGIIDRRFGEADATMTPEEKARERWALEAQMGLKKTSVFDLEEDSTFELTHGGRALNLRGGPSLMDGPSLVDDFNEEDLLSGDEDGSSGGEKTQARQSGRREEDALDGNPAPDRPKTKHEIMSEVIAKSKLYKQERQLVKDANYQSRAEADQELVTLKSLLFADPSRKEGAEQASRGQDGLAPMEEGVDKDSRNKSFNVSLKKLAMDPRSRPANRTKTEEEIASERDAMLKELEEQRQRRMKGEESDSEGESEPASAPDDQADPMAAPFAEEEDNFGLGKGIKTKPMASEMGLDDEDDFLIEAGLVASGSEVDSDEDAYSDVSDDEDGEPAERSMASRSLEEADSEFVDGAAPNMKDSGELDEDGIPYTLPCPETASEFTDLISPYPREKLDPIIRRIRGLYQLRLSSQNRARLANFSRSLVDLISTPHEGAGFMSFSNLWNVMRHIHSLAKTFSLEIGQQFRAHMQDMGASRPTALHTGDLFLLTAVGMIFSTSDHFHQVVTPAMLCIGRYLGLNRPRTLANHATGVFLAIQALQYQRESRRYVPEVMTFLQNTLCALAPAPPPSRIGDFPIHTPSLGTRVKDAQRTEVRKLRWFDDCVEREDHVPVEASTSLKIALLSTTVSVLDEAAGMWHELPAFMETFISFSRILEHLATEPCRSEFPPALNDTIDTTREKIFSLLDISRRARRTLELHHHRPLAIKTYIPVWEDDFDPNKHYDPNKDRAEMAKLKAEVKRERKGALRELRKDSRFLAREKLRIQKAKDEAYERKMKQTIAEIQNEEGRAANEYEREVKARKRARTRR